MRIVYDYIGASPRIPPVPRAIGDESGRVGRESVIVVRVGREASSRPGAVADDAPDDARLRTSDEARSRDRHVRGHENAHLSALGPYAASGILYETARGADGEAIAVGGRIAVDLAEVPGDPEATMRKARTVLNASQAPGDPSAADMRVAARAYRMMADAQAELRVERYA
ncbi:MAG: hypothetical protein CVV47_13100 [Spirochaetae bacterium HGW-Spirochaetae-3]|jgi:hypothetical protein|nr:MAG: hypothetical protein CVV47_13100 [Spirochaetae bacterium HGW-Spirochaetae-3]